MSGKSERPTAAQPAIPTTLIIDLGANTLQAAVIAGGGSWLVREPVTGSASWPAAVHWDGHQLRSGTAAEHLRITDPEGYWSDLKGCLTVAATVSQGGHWLRPIELVAGLLRTVVAEAQRQTGLAADRGLLTIPATCRPGDRYRAYLIHAAETAGLSTVELLAEPVAAVCAADLPPGSPALVWDLGASSLDISLLQVADEPAVLAAETLPVTGPDSAATDLAGLVPQALSRSGRLLQRHQLTPADLSGVLLAGGGCRLPRLAQQVASAIARQPYLPGEPELATVFGAARWLLRRGGTTVTPEPLPAGVVPLAFTLPGGTGRLVRWLLPPGQPYPAGAALARVRLAGGGLWDLTAAEPGTLDRVLVGPDGSVSSQQWLAFSATGRFVHPGHADDHP